MPGQMFAMKSLVLMLVIVCVLLGHGDALAQNADKADPAESTIRLMGAAEADLPDAVTKDIELPPAMRVNEQAVEKASRGHELANGNRERRQQGLSRADEARDKGNDISEQAKDNRENRGRFENPPGRPDGPPEPPERPNGPPG